MLQGSWQISLAGRRRRLVALAAGLVLLGWVAAGTLRWVVAAESRRADNRAALARALRWAPDDAALHHRLGNWEQFSLAGGQPERALAHYRRAAELNPHESAYWLDLADVLLLEGAEGEAARAVERAVRADPRTPRTLWRAGNFWLRAGETSRAFSYFRRVLEVQPGFAPLVVQFAHRMLGDAEVVVRRVLPPQPGLLLAYLRQLVGMDEWDAAARVWEALVGLGRRFEARRSFFYLDRLVDRGEITQAKKAWQDLQRLGLVPPAPADRELLHNAGLRRPILDGGFGWRLQPQPHVKLSRGEGRTGSHAPALVIRFLGEENLHYRHFFQFVPVEPNRRYRLRAWLRTEEVTTESGPRLELAEVHVAGGRVERSPGLVGTREWVQEEVELTTGPATRLLRVGVVRLPSRRISNKIRGTLRVTEFSLQPVEPAG